MVSTAKHKYMGQGLSPGIPAVTTDTTTQTVAESMDAFLPFS